MDLFSGAHHRIGSSSPNQGKMPFSYAAISLASDKSPPIASNPSQASSKAGKLISSVNNVIRGWVDSVKGMRLYFECYTKNVKVRPLFNAEFCFL